MAVPLVPGPGLGNANTARKPTGALPESQCDFCSVLIEPKHSAARAHGKAAAGRLPRPARRGAEGRHQKTVAADDGARRTREGGTRGAEARHRPDRLRATPQAPQEGARGRRPTPRERSGGPGFRCSRGPRSSRGAGVGARRLAWAQPLPDARVRGAVAQGGAQAGGHPGVDRARGPRCPRLGGEQQDQGRDQAGLRVPQHRQPHSPRDAQVLGPETNAAGKGGGDVISTHASSRSLHSVDTLQLALSQAETRHAVFVGRSCI